MLPPPLPPPPPLLLLLLLLASRPATRSSAQVQRPSALR
jgi:hypothetical protein